MNNKQTVIHDIIKAVYDSCVVDIDDDNKSFELSDITGNNRKESVVMTRCILVHQLIIAGYSIDTIAKILHRTEPAIRHLMKIGIDYARRSKAYNIANAQATLLCDSITSSNK